MVEFELFDEFKFLISLEKIDTGFAVFLLAKEKKYALLLDLLEDEAIKDDESNPFVLEIIMSQLYYSDYDEGINHIIQSSKTFEIKKENQINVLDALALNKQYQVYVDLIKERKIDLNLINNNNLMKVLLDVPARFLKVLEESTNTYNELQDVLSNNYEDFLNVLEKSQKLFIEQVIFLPYVNSYTVNELAEFSKINPDKRLEISKYLKESKKEGLFKQLRELGQLDLTEEENEAFQLWIKESCKIEESSEVDDEMNFKKKLHRLYLKDVPFESIVFHKNEGWGESPASNTAIIFVKTIGKKEDNNQLVFILKGKGTICLKDGNLFIRDIDLNTQVEILPFDTEIDTYSNQDYYQSDPEKSLHHLGLIKIESSDKTKTEIQSFYAPNCCFEGVDAKNIKVKNFFLIGNIGGSLEPKMYFKENTKVYIAGGSLIQKENKSIEVQGIDFVKFVSSFDKDGQFLPARVCRCAFYEKREEGDEFSIQRDVTNELLYKPKNKKWTQLHAEAFIDLDNKKEYKSIEGLSKIQQLIQEFGIQIKNYHTFIYNIYIVNELGEDMDSIGAGAYSNSNSMYIKKDILNLNDLFRSLFIHELMHIIGFEDLVKEYELYFYGQGVGKVKVPTDQGSQNMNHIGDYFTHQVNQVGINKIKWEISETTDEEKKQQPLMYPVIGLGSKLTELDWLVYCDLMEKNA